MAENSVLIIIPAYNEETTIGDVLAVLNAEGYEHVVVVDDGSTDDTVLVCKSRRVAVLQHPINLGVGSALRTGFQYAYTQGIFEYVVALDADGQHNPQDIKKLLSSAQNTGTSLVLGQRDFTHGNVPLDKKIINKLADLFTFMLSGKYIMDTQSGLRCMRLKDLCTLDLRSKGYSICSEIIIKMIKKGYKIEVVEIPAIYTMYSTSKPKKQKMGNSVKMVRNLLKY